MCILLRRSRTGWSDSSRIINTLVTYTINTCAFLTVCTVGLLISVSTLNFHVHPLDCLGLSSFSSCRILWSTPSFILYSLDVSNSVSQRNKAHVLNSLYQRCIVHVNPIFLVVGLISITFCRLNSRVSVRKVTETTSTNGGNVINLSAIYSQPTTSDNSKIQKIEEASGVRIHHTTWTDAGDGTARL